MLLLLLACTGGDDTGDVCASAEPVTWNNWGDGFNTTWCQPCHSVSSPDRYGAPENVNFDTFEDVVTWQSAIRNTVLDAGTMPVGGGLTDEDRALLEDFLACGLD